ncbi:MAG: aspartate/glutamate racemase family protein [Planctomycetota bacterium]
MKTIGILGGISAEATLNYCRELCKLTRRRLGGLHSPELLIRSLDFARIEDLQMKGEWDAAGEILNQEARRLQTGGAELIILATHTMHKLADPMMAGVHLQLIHIADATANAISAVGLNRPGLMATVLTME